MKKIFVMTVFVFFALTVFSGIKLLEPSMMEVVDKSFIEFKWEYEPISEENVPRMFSLYIGQDKDSLELYLNNLVNNFCYIYTFPTITQPNVYWAVEVEYFNGEKEISDTGIFRLDWNRFDYLNSAQHEKINTLHGKLLDFETKESVTNQKVLLITDGSVVEEAVTNSNGIFSFELSNKRIYSVYIESELYKNSSFENIQINGNSDQFLPIIYMIKKETAGKTVDFSGRIISAEKYNQGIDGVNIFIRDGLNNQTGEVITTTVTNSDGIYHLPNITIGNYTAEYNKEGFIKTFATLQITGEKKDSPKNTPLSEELEKDQIRIILEWEEIPEDLDAHLTLKTNDGENLHLFYPLSETRGGSPWPEFLVLDLDNTTGLEGPETLTIRDIRPGKYKYSVHDYSNQEHSESTELSNSNVTVRFILGNEEKEYIYPPYDQKGNIWNVFDFSINADGGVQLNLLNNVNSDYNSMWDYTELVDIYNDPQLTKPVDWKNQIPVKIISVEDNTNFPGLPQECTVLRLDIPDNINLKPENVWLFEDERAQGLEIDSSEFKTNRADIAFLIDTSGSMGTEISGVQNSLSNFVRSLNEEGKDVRVSIIPYGTAVPVSNQWQDLTDLKDNKVLNAINSLPAGGGDERPFNAIMFAYRNCNWINNSEKTIVLITDEYSNGNDAYSKQEVIDSLKGNVTVHTIVSDGDSNYSSSDNSYTHYLDPREIAVNTGGIVDYTDSKGNINLNESKLLEFIESGLYLIFIGESNTESHEIELYITTDDKKQGYWIGTLDY